MSSGTASTPSIGPGAVLGREFRVLRLLGNGGMGSVFLAEQLSTGKQRAIKVMHPQLVADTSARDRFALEARAGARVASEHIVEVVGAGVDEPTGAPWMAMELMVGQDLRTAMRERGPLGPSETLEVFTQMCHALNAAHSVGVIHRDLKPENIFLARSQRVGASFTVKILDFGIAKLVQETQTAYTQAMGSPLWMAPEQTEPGRLIGPVTDLWSLGLLAFHLLTGRYYWATANTAQVSVMGVLREVVFDPLVPASQRARDLACGDRLPAGFDEWFARCVVRDQARRFQRATEALDALRALLARPATPAAVPEPYVPTIPAWDSNWGSSPVPPGASPPTPGGHTPSAVTRGPRVEPRKVPAVVWGGGGLVAIGLVFLAGTRVGSGTNESTERTTQALVRPSTSTPVALPPPTVPTPALPEPETPVLPAVVSPPPDPPPDPTPLLGPAPPSSPRPGPRPSGPLPQRARRSELDATCRQIGAPRHSYLILGDGNHTIARARGCRQGRNSFGSTDPEIWCCPF